MKASIDATAACQGLVSSSGSMPELDVEVGPQRVLLGELEGHLAGEVVGQSAGTVELGQLGQLLVGLVASSRVSLWMSARSVSRWLLTETYSPGRHAQRAADERRHAAEEDQLPVGGRPGEAHHDRRHRDDAVVGAQDRGAQPVEQAVQRRRSAARRGAGSSRGTLRASARRWVRTCPHRPVRDRPSQRRKGSAHRRQHLLHPGGHVLGGRAAAYVLEVADPVRVRGSARACRLRRRWRSARKRPPGRRARRCRSPRTGRSRTGRAGPRPCRRAPRRTRPRRGAGSPPRTRGRAAGRPGCPSTRGARRTSCTTPPAAARAGGAPAAEPPRSCRSSMFWVTR